MKCLFLAFFVLLLPYCSGQSSAAMAIERLQRDFEEMQSVIARLRSSNTRCQTGLLDSGYCNPPTAACFTKTKTINFRLNFQGPPDISFGITHFDLSNIRVSASLVGLTKDTATIYFSCWNTSGCYRAYVSWMACGLVPI